MKLTLTVLLVSVYVVSGSYQNGQGNNGVHKMGGDKGQFEPCTPNDPKFVLTWTPEILKLGETVSITFDMTPTVSLDKGTFNVSIWLPDYQDPIYQVVQDFSCKDIHKVFPKLCPFQKGARINFPGYKVYLEPSYPLPGGQFTIQAIIKNSQGQEFACMKGVIHSVSQDY